MATGKGTRAVAERAASLSREMEREREEHGRIDEQLRQLQREKREGAKRQRQQWQTEMRTILGEALEPVLARLRKRIGDEASAEAGARLVRAVAGITKAVGTGEGCDRVLDALGVAGALEPAGDAAADPEAGRKAKPDGRADDPSADAGTTAAA